MDFQITIAERRVRIKSRYDLVYRQCKGYQTYEPESDLILETTEEDLLKERERTVKQYLLEGRREEVPSDAYLETLSVYRKMTNAFLADSVYLMHGSAVAVKEGGAVLFTAVSGVGKTTHTKLWLQNIEGASVVNGDKPLIRIKDGEVTVYGTPWCGKEGIGTNTKASLKAIFLLHRGEENQVSESSFGEELIPLLSQMHVPETEDGMIRVMEALDEMSASVKVFNLYCNMDKEAAFCSYEAVKALL